MKAEASLYTSSISTAEIEARRAHCMPCSARAAPTDGGTGLGFCKECGCGTSPRSELTFKTTMPAARCPRGLWAGQVTIKGAPPRPTPPQRNEAEILARSNSQLMRREIAMQRMIDSGDRLVEPLDPTTLPPDARESFNTAVLAGQRFACAAWQEGYESAQKISRQQHGAVSLPALPPSAPAPPPAT